MSTRLECMRGAKMAWIRNYEPSWIHRICANVLKSGEIPKHVAFIMDGNRRFAKKNNMVNQKGHVMGFDKLAETLQWCKSLGITEVTVYAFSIENFKRPEDEVTELMDLVREKFTKLLEEKEKLTENEICVRIIGNLTLLPEDIQALISEAVCCTKNNNKLFLNVCLSYTSRDEICCAMREIAEGVQLGLLKESDVSDELMNKCLYTNDSPDPNLLVRTSGEVRFSDFLLWQTSFSVLSFLDILWPEFTIWHLYGAILHYQRHCNGVKDARDIYEDQQKLLLYEQDMHCVLQKEKDLRSKDESEIKEAALNYSNEREARIRTFLAHLENKRSKYFEDLRSKKCFQSHKETMVY